MKPAAPGSLWVYWSSLDSVFTSISATEPILIDTFSRAWSALLCSSFFRFCIRYLSASPDTVLLIYSPMRGALNILQQETFSSGDVSYNYKLLLQPDGRYVLYLEDDKDPSHRFASEPLDLKAPRASTKGEGPAKVNQLASGSVPPGKPLELGQVTCQKLYIPIRSRQFLLPDETLVGLEGLQKFASRERLWLGYPYMMLVCTGMLQSVSSTIYEASAIDGSNPIVDFFRLTLPLVFQPLLPILDCQLCFQFQQLHFGLSADGRWTENDGRWYRR